MSILPSPPHPSRSPEPVYHSFENTMKSVIASSWRVVEQPPPPTLREILEAYKARGDGDREMLLAMLNAKSSEDQRVASLASLHRTMLDMYQGPHAQVSSPIAPVHLPDSHHGQSYSHPHHFPSPPLSYHHSPHAPASQHVYHDQPRHYRTESSSSMTDPARDRDRDRDRASIVSSSSQSRKRRRTSRSPPPHPRARGSPPQEAMGSHLHDLPPSPYSSASSAQSSGGSPRSRESMTINSLLLNSGPRDEDMPKRNTSSERSTTMNASRER